MLSKTKNMHLEVLNAATKILYFSLENCLG